MAREILFRAKRKDNGEWVCGDLLHPDIYGNGYAIEDFTKGKNNCFDIDEKTICQYTGLKDKNGTKIFEGDICQFREWSKGDMCWIGEVHYEHQQYVISGNKNKECETPFTLTMSRFISEDIEVIGNKFDNPELLEVQDEQAN